MSADQPLTGDELATIKARAEDAALTYSDRWSQRVLREDVPRLVAEIERLRAENAAVLHDLAHLHAMLRP